MMSLLASPLMPVARQFTLTLAWVALALNLALAVPAMALWPEAIHTPVNLLAPLLTFGFVAWAVVAVIRVVGGSGAPLRALPYTLLIFLLFTLLFLQVFCHWGAQHYDWRRSPSVLDWVLFAGAHAVRAADIVDFIEAYNYRIQLIEHNSPLVSTLLVIFHLTMNLFFVALFVAGFRRLWKAVARRQGEGWRKWLWKALPWVGLVAFVGVWLYAALVWQPWRTRDLYLWPIDNLLRCVDVMDAMELYSIRLHQVPRLWWTSTLAFVFRLFLSLTLVGVIGWVARRISLSYLNGFGIRRDDLADLARTGSPEVQAWARSRLAKLADVPPAPLSDAWREFALAAPVAAVVLLGLGLMTGWGRWDSNSVRLAAAAVGPDEESAGRALSALRHLGTYGREALGPLTEALPNLDEARQIAVIETLGAFGHGSREALARLVREGDENRAAAAVRSVAPQKDRGMDVLLAGLDHPSPEVRDLAREAIRALGPNGSPAILRVASMERAPFFMELLDDIDPYWHMLNTGGTQGIKLLYLKRGLMEFEYYLRGEDPPAGPRYYLGAVTSLGELGEKGAWAVPMLRQLLALPRRPDGNEVMRGEFLRALARITRNGKTVTPEVRAALSDEDFRIRRAAVEVLGELGPAPTTGELLGQRFQDDQEYQVRKAALVALCRWKKEGVPILLDGLASVENYQSGSASPRGVVDDYRMVRDALEAAGKEWKESPAARKVVTALVILLAQVRFEGDEARRQAISELLFLFNPNWQASTEARAALPSLLRQLEDPGEYVRCQAAVLLSEFRPPPPNLRDIARALQGSRDARIRHAARSILNRLSHEQK